MTGEKSVAPSLRPRVQAIVVHHWSSWYLEPTRELSSRGAEVSLVSVITEPPRTWEDRETDDPDNLSEGYGRDVWGHDEDWDLPHTLVKVTDLVSDSRLMHYYLFLASKVQEGAGSPRACFSLFHQALDAVSDDNVEILLEGLDYPLERWGTQYSPEPHGSWPVRSLDPARERSFVISSMGLSLRATRRETGFEIWLDRLSAPTDSVSDRGGRDACHVGSCARRLLGLVGPGLSPVMPPPAVAGTYRHTELLWIPDGSGGWLAFDVHDRGRAGESEELDVGGPYPVLDEPPPDEPDRFVRRRWILRDRQQHDPGLEGHR